MKKILLFFTLMIFVLAGCGAQNEAAPETTPEPFVDIGGTQVERDAASLDLTASAYDISSLVSAGKELSQVKEIKLGEITMSHADFAAIEKAYPNAKLDYSLTLFGKTLDAKTKVLDLADMDITKTDELAAILPFMSELEEINFLDGDGSCAYDLTDLDLLDEVREAAPEAKLDVAFDLFGQTVTSEDERIEYLQVHIGNDGAETVRRVIPYLTNCTYFLMDGCDIDYELLSQMRDEFPDTKIVWRVWIGPEDYGNPRSLRRVGFLTDTQRIRSVFISDENSSVLRYCNEAKYVDLGHIPELTDISFLGYMPELEALILALTSVSDISVLSQCPNLEYLEICQTLVTDVSPLAECHNLKHLNLGWTAIADITPLMDLEFDRFWGIGVPTPTEQFEEYMKLHPLSTVQIYGESPLHHGWRWNSDFSVIDPRYELLREQMEYGIDAMYGIP